MLDWDLALAAAHHLIIFALFAALAGELLLVRAGMLADDVRRAAGLDAFYGMMAFSILVIGFIRALYAAKGWDYYSGNPFFHAKLAAFIAVGLLSIWPTVQYIRWNARLKADAADGPRAAEIARVRQIIWAEIAIFALIPVFAAAMARGIGN